MFQTKMEIEHVPYIHISKQRRFFILNVQTIPTVYYQKFR